MAWPAGAGWPGARSTGRGSDSGLVDDALATLNPPPAEASAEEDPPTAHELLQHLDRALNTGPPLQPAGARRRRRARPGRTPPPPRAEPAAAASDGGRVGRARPGRAGGPGRRAALADALAGALFYTRLMSPRRLSRADLDRLVRLLLPDVG